MRKAIDKIWFEGKRQLTGEWIKEKIFMQYCIMENWLKVHLKWLSKKCTNKGFNQQQSSKEIWMQQKKDKKRRTNHTRVTTKKQLCFGMHDWRNWKVTENIKRFADLSFWWFILRFRVQEINKFWLLSTRRNKFNFLFGMKWLQDF